MRGLCRGTQGNDWPLARGHAGTIGNAEVLRCGTDTSWLTKGLFGFQNKSPRQRAKYGAMRVKYIWFTQRCCKRLEAQTEGGSRRIKSTGFNQVGPCFKP